MKNGVIYKIENPTGKIYIGKSIDFSSRLSAYRALRCKDQRALYSSLKKYGFNAHNITILYEGPANILSEKEIEYIQEYKSFSPDNKNGLNLTKGGDGQLGHKHSPETIKKMTQAHIGAKRSAESRKRMSDAAKKRTPNRTGKKHTEETLEKMSAIKKGKIQSRDTIELRKQTLKQNRAKEYGNILQISCEGHIVKDWEPSFGEIARAMKCDPTTIRSAVMSNGEKIRVGYKWKYSKK